MNTGTSIPAGNQNEAAAETGAARKGGTHATPVQVKAGRTGANVQRKIQADAGSSEQVQQLKAVQDMLNNSTQVKQLRAVQSMANNRSGHAKNIPAHKPLQGYFTITVDEEEKDTNNLTDFPLAAEDTLWAKLKPLLTTEKVTDAFLEEYKDVVLKLARAPVKRTILNATRYFESMIKAKTDGEKPVSDVSTTGMTNTTAQSDGDKPKHASVTYLYNNGAGGTEAASFALDKYTKKGESDLGAGAWSKETIKIGIRLWTMKEPLVRHLAQWVLPKLGTVDKAHRKWEMYIREMERVLIERTTEAMNRTLTITPKPLARLLPGQKQPEAVSFTRKTLEVSAREKVKEKLLADTAPPGSQNEIPFFDDLIRKVLDDKGLKTWYTTDEGTALKWGPKVLNDPGMTLVHWRTILLFDWQAGNEIWKNGV